ELRRCGCDPGHPSALSRLVDYRSPPVPLAAVAIPVVYLDSCGDLRHLHPFPTRRSSDLRGSSGSCSTRRSSWARTASAPCHDATDRKSTRLNSSHGSSSYAVFCLKNKKATPTWLTTSAICATSASHRAPPQHRQGLPI